MSFTALVLALGVIGATSSGSAVKRAEEDEASLVQLALRSKSNASEKQPWQPSDPDEREITKVMEELEETAKNRRGEEGQVSTAQDRGATPSMASLAWHMAKTTLHAMKDPDCKMLVQKGVTASAMLDMLVDFHYGNSCGEGFGSSSWGTVGKIIGKRCGPESKHKSKWVDVFGVKEEVCEDSGLDACCAHHDWAKVSYYLQVSGKKAWIGECGVNNELTQCARKASQKASTFSDGFWTEAKASHGPLCLFRHMPCLAVTAFPGKYRLTWPMGNEVELEKAGKCRDNCYTSNPKFFVNITDGQILS